MGVCWISEVPQNTQAGAAEINNVPLECVIIALFHTRQQIQFCGHHHLPGAEL